MTQSVRIAKELVELASHYEPVTRRSAQKQIEYWAKIGKAAEDNPELPFNFIRDILSAEVELRAGNKEPYVLGETS